MEIAKEWVAEKITQWEHANGESFFDDCPVEFNILQYYTFCFAKDYINREQFNDWYSDYIEQKLEAHDSNYFIYNDEGECGPSYAIVTSDEYDYRIAKKAYTIFGEFIASADVLVDRFMAVIEEADLDA